MHRTATALLKVIGTKANLTKQPFLSPKPYRELGGASLRFFPILLNNSKNINTKIDQQTLKFKQNIAHTCNLNRPCFYF